MITCKNPTAKKYVLNDTNIKIAATEESFFAQNSGAPDIKFTSILLVTVKASILPFNPYDLIRFWHRIVFN